MPIYEYQCQQCGHAMEVTQKMSDEPLVKCPACGKNKLQKLVSMGSFQLKGSGWYATDYAKKPPATSSTAESSTKTPATEASNITTTEKAKPAAASKKGDAT
jgi:putative FmdB family regulatory protein